MFATHLHPVLDLLLREGGRIVRKRIVVEETGGGGGGDVEWMYRFAIMTREK